MFFAGRRVLDVGFVESGCDAIALRNVLFRSIRYRSDPGVAFCSLSRTIRVVS